MTKVKVVEIYKNGSVNPKLKSARYISEEALLKGVESHREDAADVMNELANELRAMGERHDHTKIEHFEEYYKDFYDSTIDPETMDNTKWQRFHAKAERHHLKKECPSDVTLLDVLEMAVNHVCYWKTSTGKVDPVALKGELLQKAFKNTLKYIDKNTKVI